MIETRPSSHITTSILLVRPSDTDLEATNCYMKDNTEVDVGIRDLMKLHVWTLTAHPVSILMGFNSDLQTPLDDDCDSYRRSLGYYIAFPTQQLVLQV